MIDAGLAASIRAGTVARHTLFRLEHSQGTVLAWDGVGDIDYDGETYKGGIGQTRIRGVSDSSDFQNHDVVAELNGVPLDALSGVDPDISGKAASITLPFVNDEGVIVYTREVFVGEGDYLRTRRTGDQLVVIAHLTSFLSDWAAAPGAFYTDRDQKRRFPGDTGFSQVSRLQNFSVTGWSKNTEVVAAKIVWDSVEDVLKRSDSGRLIGDDFSGINQIFVSNQVSRRNGGGGNKYVEEVTGASATVTSGELALASGPCFMNVNGFVQSPGGQKLINNRFRDETPNPYLRELSEITSDGTPTAEKIRFDGDGNGNQIVARVSIAVAFGAWKGAINDSKNGNLEFPGTSNGATMRTVYGHTGVYREINTGVIPTLQGGFLQVGGGDCVVSTTGVILTPAGNRIARTGEPDAFLRIWS